MLKKPIEDILNQQIEKEGYSSSLYLAMAVWAGFNGYNGVAKWLYSQAEEERIHMLKILHYIDERNGKPVIPQFKQPPVEFKNVRQLFEDVLKHEEYITASINDIVATTNKEQDFNTHSFIQWFVNEQIEEEAQVSEILDKLKLVGENNMYIFDRDLPGMRSAQNDPGTAE
jgi:ferritin